jgi:drug/metabolite transporter (DMT)-like permease
LNVSLFFLAVKHTSVADANIISALQPAVLLVLVGPLFAEQVTPATVGWTAVAIGGVALAVFASARGAGRTAGGDLLACAALGTWVWYFVASKRARRELGALEYQTGLTLVAACVVTPLALASGQRLTMPDAATVGWVALIVAVPGGGHLLMNWAHGYAPLTLTSQLTLAVPVVAIVAAVVFLGEPVTALQLVGLAVVLGALAIVLRTSMRVLPVAPEPGAP